MTKSLSGKVALVTGGSRGIGAAIAKRLAAEGAAVAITYVNGKQQAEGVVDSIKGAGGQAIAIRADSGNPKEVISAVEETARTLKRLDILVNNAGVFVSGTVDDPTNEVAKFDRQYAINVGGAVAAVRAAAKLIGAGGRIISVGSTLGSHVPFPGLSDYSATKAAVAGYTKGWARDFGPKGITVNTIQPGP